jgi:uncharacterized membrane-anchored protein
MRLTSRSQTLDAPRGLAGTLRVDRRTSALVRRLQPGDIAVVEELDLDRRTAEALLDRGVAAVVDAAPMISGRYPNLGPELLAKAGVVLVDDVGTEGLAGLDDGTAARVVGGTVYAGDRPVLSGTPLGLDDVVKRMDRARDGLGTQLESLTHQATEFLRREQELLLHGLGVPELRTPLAGRPAVVVVRDFDHRDELRGLRRFIREQRPVLVAVDDGADALLQAGHRPDVLVVGEQGLAAPVGADLAEPAGGRAGRTHGHAVSDRGLRSAGEVVLHTDGTYGTDGTDGTYGTDGTGVRRGAERLERAGVRAHRMAGAGATGDVAVLLADLRGATPIVTVGAHATLEEFLDGRRAGLGGTFLTRLRVGPRLVDAKAVPALYSGRVRTWHLLLVLLAGLAALLAAVLATPAGAELADRLGQWWDPVRGSVGGWAEAAVTWVEGVLS